MGISGFTPFLQKICPTVLKRFPERLKALEGKRIVIDGTLITQRFHFVSNEHANYHVLGWYRLARELDKNNISAICVFDGKERSMAKTDELKRRQEVRQLTITRGSIEDARFRRLHDLKAGMDQLQSLDDSTRQQTLKLLKESTFSAVDGSAALLDQTAKETANIEPSTTEVPVVEPSDIIKPPPVRALPPDSTLSNNPAGLASLLKSLHISYKANIAKLVSIPTDTSELQPILPEEDRSDKTMTKRQYELTVQEGKVWAEICDGVNKSTLEISAIAEKEVDNLLDKSHIMAASFQKRNNAPTARTYQDSKEILEAMGILCIDATGAIEAEALASSMVLNGLADYVVSEDTDVLAYEAPMIRNITSPVEPLLVISGANVREKLDLDRNAYIDLVLLLGTDFSHRIKHLGPIRAYDLIKKHGSIERILDAIEHHPRYKLKLSREAYMTQVQIARLVFGTLPPVPPPERMKRIDKNDRQVTKVLRHYGLERYVTDELDYENALSGTFFQDNPYAA